MHNLPTIGKQTKSINQISIFANLFANWSISQASKCFPIPNCVNCFSFFTSLLSDTITHPIYRRLHRLCQPINHNLPSIDFAVIHLLSLILCNKFLSLGSISTDVGIRRPTQARSVTITFTQCTCEPDEMS